MFNTVFPPEIYDNASTSGSYNANKYYNDNVMQTSYYPYQFDGWYRKKNYGILYNNNIIYPQKAALRNYLNNNGITHKNIFFVVDAFFDMKKYVKSLVTKGIIADISSIFSQLNTQESTTDVESLYLNHLNVIYNNFMEQFIPNIPSINNLQEFAKYFLMYFHIISKKTIINRSIFIGSSLAPDSINGLYISFDRAANPQNIISKSNGYISHPTFKDHTEIAARFGFFVDRNFPWRIVADLSSPAMKNYYIKYNLKDPQDIFQKLYHRPYSVDLISLRNVFISLWNGYVQKYTVVTNNRETTNCAKLFSEVNTLQYMNESIFEQYFNINWQLRLYLYTRMLEEQITLTQIKFDKLHEEACQINKFYDTSRSLEYINKELFMLTSVKNNNLFSSLTTGDALVKLLSGTQFNVPTSAIIF